MNFKNFLKNSVQNLVGSNNNNNNNNNSEQFAGPPEDGTPSAVFPTEEVTAATINVKNVLHADNCYSGRGARKRGSVAEIPRIVVTDQGPRRPPRRSSAAIIIRPSVSSPDVRDDEEEEEQQQPSFAFGFPPGFVTPPTDEIAGANKRLPRLNIESPGGTRRNSENTVPKVGSLEKPPLNNSDAEKELKKKMAVLKIREAMERLNTDNELLQRPNLKDRRYSDISLSRSTTDLDQMGQQPHQQPRQSLTPTNSTKRRRSGVGGGNGGTNISRSSSMRKQKPKPMIWDHFDQLPNTRAQGRCKACKMNVSCKFNTGNFVRHLQLAHKDVYRRYQNKIESQWTQSMLERNLCS